MAEEPQGKSFLRGMVLALLSKGWDDEEESFEAGLDRLIQTVKKYEKTMSASETWMIPPS